MPWIVDWVVKINGRDLSSRMRPFLLDIEVTDKEGFSSDACSLTFDDTAGRLKLPAKGSLVEVYLQGALVFKGISDSPRSSGTRGGGRILKVTAKGFDLRGRAKTKQSFHLDDATLKDFLGKAAQDAGFSLKIDEKLGGIKRDYWSADGESFQALGQRLARELHATFKLRDKVAVFAGRGASMLGAVVGTVGDHGNVISWDIAPSDGRGSYRKAKVRWFDRKKAKFEEQEVDIDAGAEAEGENVVSGLAVDEDGAKERAEARKGEAERDAGGGRVEMDLTPSAQAEAPFILTGARRGFDGSYCIVSVQHRANRSGGATTSLEIKQPGDGAGTDDRAASGG